MIIPWITPLNEGLEARMLYLDISKATGRLAWKPWLDLAGMVSYTLEEYAVEGMKAEEVFGQRIRHIREYEKMA